MNVIFDGREFARKREEELRFKIQELKKGGIIPRLAAILIGDDSASRLYTTLKKKATERVGAEVRVIGLSQSLSEITRTIEGLNNDKKVHGIMIQLPLPEKMKLMTNDLLQEISLNKDVDGLRNDSQFMPATVKAILDILEEALNIVRLPLRGNPCKVVVIGSKGEIGRRLMKIMKRDLRFKNLEVEGYDKETRNLESKTKEADILISATGVADLIKEGMVKEKAIVIDVGSPRGDVSREAYKKAGFITPVPGGVGPVTISSLLENLIIAASKLI